MKVRTVLWVLALASLLAPSFPEPPLQTGAYLQDATTTSVKVCHVAASPVAVEVEVVPVEGEAEPIRVSSPAARRHAVPVDGLRPGTAYRYALRVVGGAAIGDGRFRTPPADASQRVRFAVVGDSGGLPVWVNVSRGPLVYGMARAGWLPSAPTVSRIGALLAAAEPQFWLHTGDVVYPRGENRHYGPGFFVPFARALANAPVYPVIGNHDWETDHGRPFLRNFVLPSAERGGEQLFTFAWGPVRVIGANCSRGMGPRLAAEYVAEVLAAAREPWRVVVEHYPPLSASRQGDSQALLAELWPTLQRHRVDLLLVGHDHTYQRFAPDDGLNLVVTGGGGKSLYDLVPHDRLVVAHSVYHFCVVECDARELVLRAIDIEGRELDRLQLRKPE